MVVIGSGSKNNHYVPINFMYIATKLILSACILMATLFIYHSRKGHLKIVTNLVTSTNANVNSKDNRGQTALHIACA